MESPTKRIYQNALHYFEGKRVCFTGIEPYNKKDLMSYLPDIVSAHDVDEDGLDTFDNIRFFVLGQSDYDMDMMEQYVSYSGPLTAFLPQEGFIDLLLFGYDWWHGENIENPVPSLVTYLDMTLQHHNGLRYAKSLENGYFDWPSTETILANDTPGIGTEDVWLGYLPETDLYKAGYMLWKNGRRLEGTERLQILSRIVNRHVPSLGRVLHLKEISKTIASHCKKSKRQGRHSSAIKSYETDLQWLKETYFNSGRNGFIWPSVDVP